MAAKGMAAAGQAEVARALGDWALEGVAAEAQAKAGVKEEVRVVAAT